MNTIIEKIRAEVERRIKSWQTRGEHSPEGQGKDTCVSRVTELTDLLSFLSDLEKECEEKPMNPVLQDFPTTEKEMQDFLATHERIPVPERLNSLERILQEQPVKIDIRKELASIEFMGVNDARDSETIARHFYDLGRQSKPTTAEGDVFKEWGTTEKDYLDKSMEKVRLEMEIATYLKDWEEDEEIGLHLSTDNGCIPIELDDVRDLARHFYELGRQSKPKVSEGLETEALRSAGVLLSEHFEDEDDDAIRTTALRCWKGGVIHGASWQKEQMMRSAVEGEVRNIIIHENGDEVHYSITYPKGKSQYSINDEVKIIIL